MHSRLIAIALASIAVASCGASGQTSGNLAAPAAPTTTSAVSTPTVVATTQAPKIAPTLAVPSVALPPASIPTSTLPPATIPVVTLDPRATPTFTVQAVAPSPVPTISAFDPLRFIGQGDRYNCGDFASQSQAQAVLRADPHDPNRLDTDRDGIACETNPSPFDRVPVPRP